MNFLRNIKIFKSINEYAKPTETLIIGVLVGILLGLTSLAFLPVDVKKEHHNTGINLCGSIENVELIQISVTSKIKYVQCVDGRKFRNF